MRVLILGIMKKSISATDLPDSSVRGSVDSDGEFDSVGEDPTPKIDIDDRVESLLKVFPSKGWISREAIGALKSSIMDLVSDAVKNSAV